MESGGEREGRGNLLHRMAAAVVHGHGAVQEELRPVVRAERDCIDAWLADHERSGIHRRIAVREAFGRAFPQVCGQGEVYPPHDSHADGSHAGDVRHLEERSGERVVG